MPEIKGVILGPKEAKLALYENRELLDVTNQGHSHVSFYIDNFEDAKCFFRKYHTNFL